MADKEYSEVYDSVFKEIVSCGFVEAMRENYVIVDIVRKSDGKWLVCWEKRLNLGDNAN